MRVRSSRRVVLKVYAIQKTLKKTSIFRPSTNKCSTLLPIKDYTNRLTKKHRANSSTFNQPKLAQSLQNHKNMQPLFSSMYHSQLHSNTNTAYLVKVRFWRKNYQGIQNFNAHLYVKTANVYRRQRRTAHANTISFACSWTINYWVYEQFISPVCGFERCQTLGWKRWTQRVGLLCLLKASPRWQWDGLNLLVSLVVTPLPSSMLRPWSD